MEWREDGFSEYQDECDNVDLEVEELSQDIPRKLERQILATFYKKRFLDLVHNFVIFDKGIKKVCRYNQYYAVKRAQHRLMDKHGGIIWHTQGSGKSLTMVWLSKWILANKPNARVLIVTDREELDEQIEKIYKGVDEKIVRTKSGKDLLERLDTFEDRLVCSLIHKFGKRGSDSSELDYEKYVRDLLAALPRNFCAKGEIVVFVDECHRTQSGKLHEAMKAILPGAVFVGFTGTPLLKKDKKTSLEIFGGYIHAYKFNEGVRDGIVLDLRYEARDVPQDITSQTRIDTWFDAKTVGLTPKAKAKLNPAYFAKMSAILEQLILERKRGVIVYSQLLEVYMKLAKNVEKPGENSKYPERVRSNGALRALYDNCGEDEQKALKLHKAIVRARQEGFRHNPVKENKIKRTLYQILNEEDEVERIYQIVVEQEEY